MQFQDLEIYITTHVMGTGFGNQRPDESSRRLSLGRVLRLPQRQKKKKFSDDHRNNQNWYEIVSIYYTPCTVQSSPFSVLLYFFVKVLWYEFSPLQELNLTGIN